LADAQNEEFRIKKPVPQGDVNMILDRTKEEITEIIRNLERLRIRLSEVHAAATIYPTSLDVARLETALSKQWNSLVSELSAAGVEHDYQPRTIPEEEPQELNFWQNLFLESGLDVRDLTADDKPKPGPMSDGLGSLIGY
jgi:hypothetical protein